MSGFWKRILKVDLSNTEVKIEDVDDHLYPIYFGGSGLSAYLLYQRKRYAVDPLGPENDLVLMPGLLTGAPVYTASKTSICARSPLTGIWGEATFGGHWGAGLKLAGYDGIWVTGVAKSPVYLWVTEDKVEIRDAESVWGKNTFETNTLLRERTNAKAVVVCIGRAGEKLSKMASVMSEGMNARAAGRTGLGAVMGSKQLKGIAVLRGKPQALPIFDSHGLTKSLQEFLPTLKKFSERRTAFGTAGVVVPKEAIGGLPLKNFSLGIRWKEGADRISGQTIAKTIFQNDYTCFYCPIKCGKDVKISSGPYANLVGHGPEYETIAGFGSNFLNDNLESIVAANFLCNDYGLDTISTSATLAFAFEAFERGLLTKKDCDGLELTWGNAEVILEMIRKIGEQEGIGAMLADGSRMAAQKLGGASEEFVTHSKGLEPSITTPTPTVSIALSWATSNRGACHLEGFSHIVEGGVPFNEMGYGDVVDGLTGEGKGHLVKVMQNFMATFNALGLCKFLFAGRLRPSLMAHWVNCVTGWNLDAEEMMTVGDRLYNLKRAYNIHTGVSRVDDIITSKLLSVLKVEGSQDEKRLFFEKMLEDYYRERGWDKKGIPTQEILNKLGLGFVSANFSRSESNIR
jgi:aldehyde:ferredoxin oxidoreductase